MIWIACSIAWIQPYRTLPNNCREKSEAWPFPGARTGVTDPRNVLEAHTAISNVLNYMEYRYTTFAQQYKMRAMGGHAGKDKDVSPKNWREGSSANMRPKEVLYFNGQPNLFLPNCK